MGDSTGVFSSGSHMMNFNNLSNLEEMKHNLEEKTDTKESTELKKIGAPHITVDPMKDPTPMFRFAMLEVATAKNIRDSATSIMNNIADTQRAQKSASQYLDQFRKNQNDAATAHGEGSGNKYVKIQQWQIDWLKAHNIKYPSKVDKGDLFLNTDEWDLIGKGTQAFIDNIGSSTQQKMVQAQDALGQYNAHVQGATSSINSNIELSRSVNTTQPF